MTDQPVDPDGALAGNRDTPGPSPPEPGGDRAEAAPTGDRSGEHAAAARSSGAAAPEPGPSVPAAPATPAAGRRPRLWWLALAAVLLLFVVAVPTAIVLLDDDEPERVRLPLPDPERLIGPGGSELATLLARGREKTFHATYTLTAGERRETLEWWNDGERARQDTTVAGEAGTVRTASFRLAGNDSVACRQDPGQAWACERVEPAVGGDPRGLLATLQAQLAGRPVAVRSDRIRDRDARCFSVAATAGSEAVELCTDPDGVPLRLSSAEATLELTALDDAVPDRIFEPPAKP